jgi:hypothetical protein
MRTLLKAILVLGFVAAMADAATSPVHAQYYYPPPPPPPYYYRYGPPPPPPPYYGRGGYYGRPTYNGCPPHYTIQGGVCKPYRGW